MSDEDEEAKQLVEQLKIVYAQRVKDAQRPPKPLPTSRELFEWLTK